LLREQQGVREIGTATVSENVSKQAGGITTCQNWLELAETRPLLANAGEPDRFTIHNNIMNQRYILFRRTEVFYYEVDEAMPERGQFFPGLRPRTNRGRGQFAFVESSRLRTVCGQSMTVATACSCTNESVAGPWTRTVWERGRGRGQSADADCSRTWTVCVRDRH
jgi:hypothetical protein